MRPSFHSLRWRVQSWHGLILLLVVAAFCATAYRLVREDRLRRIDQEIVMLDRSVMIAMSKASGHKAEQPRDHEKGPPPPPSPQAIFDHIRRSGAEFSQTLLAEFRGSKPGFQFFCLYDWTHDKVLFSSDNLPAGLLPLPKPSGEFLEELRTVNNRREFVHSTTFGLATVTGRDITPDLEDLRRIAWSLAGIGLAVWLGGLVVGGWLVGRAIRPIEDISRAASRIAAGNLKERIATRDNESELGQLSRVLNDTFARLNDVFDNQKQFTADASHELRTPVTILLSETQRALKRDRTGEEYREVLRTCQEAAQRMRRLTEALLLLAQQEAGAAQPQRERCDLGAIAREAAEHLGTVSEQQKVTVTLKLEAAACLGEHASLAILASNLISNAIQHNREGGMVEVRSGRVGDRVYLAVRDDGPGIPAQDLPHIFQRFYRSDKARGSSEGHVGLGLAIAQTVAAKHGGEITVESEFGKGACFTLGLPAL